MTASSLCTLPEADPEPPHLTEYVSVGSLKFAFWGLQAPFIQWTSVQTMRTCLQIPRRSSG